ncbi:MAG: hypothetical protein LBV30_01040 [Propionibacteriaceae bacterium]|nr:hypothetical protein [Propionibacteriaceae bacterium]
MDDAPRDLLADFEDVLARLPPLDQYSHAVLRQHFPGTTIAQETNASMTFFMAISHQISLQCNHIGQSHDLEIFVRELDPDYHLPLVKLARQYGNDHHISVESYYFYDSHMAMYGFGDADDGRQVDITQDPTARPRPGKAHWPGDEPLIERNAQP